MELVGNEANSKSMCSQASCLGEREREIPPKQGQLREEEWG